MLMRVHECGKRLIPVIIGILFAEFIFHFAWNFCCRSSI